MGLLKLTHFKMYFVKPFSKYIINLCLKFCSLQNGTSCKFKYTQLLLSNIGWSLSVLRGFNTLSCNLEKQHKTVLQIRCRFSVQHLPLGATFKSWRQLGKSKSPGVALCLTHTKAPCFYLDRSEKMPLPNRFTFIKIKTKIKLILKLKQNYYEEPNLLVSQG